MWPPQIQDGGTDCSAVFWTLFLFLFHVPLICMANKNESVFMFTFSKWVRMEGMRYRLRACTRYSDRFPVSCFMDRLWGNWAIKMIWFVLMQLLNLICIDVSLHLTEQIRFHVFFSLLVIWCTTLTVISNFINIQMYIHNIPLPE